MIAGGAVGDVLHVAGGAVGRGGGPAVHLVDEDDRQFPRGSGVHGLVERTAVAGAVAEEHHGHLIGLQDILEGQSRAGGQIVAAAHDAVGAQHADGEIGDVHGAAAALAQARLLAEDLRHHAVDIGALGHAVTMAAVGGFNHIVITQSGAHAGGDGFLTDVGVGEAGDLAGEEVVLDALLKLADRAHRLIELDGKFFRVNCIVRHNDHAPF